MENEIIQYLKERYNAQAIILAGSRASNSTDAYSDWDLYVLTDTKQKNIVDVFKGEQLDIIFVTLPLAEDDILKTFAGPLEYVTVLYDPESITENLVKRTQKARSNGPLELTKEQRNERELRAKRFINKVRRAQDDSTRFYYLGYFLDLMIRNWFEYRNDWPMNPYQAIPYFKEADLRFDKAMNIITSIASHEEKVKACIDLYQIVFSKPYDA